MKKLIILFYLAIVALSCSDSKEEKAQERLDAARSALEREDFNGAKLQIDSIRILYPEEYKVRKASQDLLCIVVLKEQQHNLRFLSSMLQTKQQEFEMIKGQYVFEKNAEYQDIGNYFWKTQTVEHNLHRSFIRFQVSEQGVMTITSIYHGSRFIHHRAIKVSTPDGTYAETPFSTDVYESNDMGEKFERADFHYGSDNGVINFLYSNRNKNIRVEFIGGKGHYAVAFSPSDKEALINLYPLATVLVSIQKIKTEIDDANVKIKFVLKKQKYDSLYKHNHDDGQDQNQDDDDSVN